MPDINLNTILPFLLGAAGGALSAYGGRILKLIYDRCIGRLTIMGEHYDTISEELFKLDILKSYVYGELAANGSPFLISREVDLSKPKNKSPICRLGPNWVKTKINGTKIFIYVSETVHQMGTQDRRILFWGRPKNVNKVREWCKSVIELKENKNEKFLKVYTYSPNYWRLDTLRYKRHMKTVYHKHGKQWEILNKIREWEATEEWHTDRGLNFHYGILLSGTPGTGKTTMALAIATELQRDLYLINNKYGSDQITGVPEGSIILFDECDALFKKEEVEDLSEFATGDSSDEELSPEGHIIENLSLEDFLKYGDSALAKADGNQKALRKSSELSTLLTALDGPTSKHNIITIFTTNNIAALPDSLLRPGRIDIIEYFDTHPPEDFLDKCLNG